MNWGSFFLGAGTVVALGMIALGVMIWHAENHPEEEEGRKEDR